MQASSSSDAPRGPVGAGFGERVRYYADFVEGVLQRGANVVANLRQFPAPVGGIVFLYQGDLFDPNTAGERHGAAAATDLLRSLRVAGMPDDPTARRARRRLLASTRVNAPHDGAITTLRFQATARGVNWAVRGRESALVSVYVDGRYHSDVTVMSERQRDHYTVNLGTLAQGPHTVELRHADDIDGLNRSAPGIHSLRSSVASGLQADVLRHAPILEGRDLGGPSARAEGTYTDTPLIMTPKVTPLADGGKLIAYSVLFSNEDSGTDPQRLFRDYGRGTDFEEVYVVRLDRAGRRVGAIYQGPRHAYQTFTGTFEGDRPVLRLASGNNNFSQNLNGEGTRWSPSPTRPVARRSSIDLMRRHPWVFGVMAKEMVREGDARFFGPLGKRQVGDPRNMLYVAGTSDAVRTAFEQGRGVVLRLRGGKRVVVEVGRRSRLPHESMAVPLPTGVSSDAVIGVEYLRGDVFVLDPAFRPRRLLTAI